MLLSLLLVPSLVWAEDIYIAQNTAGLDNGSSCANAHSAVWFNTATNWALGVGKISGGDTAHLCGIITSQMVARASGTAGNVITIFFEPSAKLSQAVCPITGCFNTNQKSFLVLNGGTNGVVENTNNGTSPTYGNELSSIGINAVNSSNLEIMNLTIRNMYVHTVDLADDQVSYSDVNAIRYSGSNVRIHHNVLHDAGWAIFHVLRDGNTNIEIDNNEIYNSSHGVTLGGFGALTVSVVRVHNNHTYDFGNWDTTSNKYHHDGIHVYGVSGGVVNDLDIYNNLYDGNCGNHMTGLIYSSGGDTGERWERMRVFNNVLKCTTLVNGQLWLVRGNNFEIYNNTIIGASTSTCVKLSDLTDVKVKNNVLSSCNYFLHFQLPAVTFTNAATDMNYNIYADQQTQAWHWEAVCPFCKDIAIWRTNCGCDESSTYNASLLLDSIGHPTEGSPVIGAGANLTILGNPDLNKDKVLIARPSSGAWTAGAYNFASDTVGPAAPTNLTAQ